MSALPPTLCPDDRFNALLATVTADDEAGMRRLEDLLAIFEADPRLHFLKGSLLAGQKQYPAAHDAMARAVALAPNFDIARFQLGFLEFSSGDARSAEATWASLQRLSPDDALRLFAEGLVHLGQDRFELARAALTIGIAHNQQNPPLNHDIGLILKGMDDLLSAAQAPDEVSATHLLLRQYGPGSTRH